MILLNIYIYICFINNIAFLKKKIKKYKIITQAWSIQPIQTRERENITSVNRKKKTKTKLKGLAEILMP